MNKKEKRWTKVMAALLIVVFAFCSMPGVAIASETFDVAEKNTENQSESVNIEVVETSENSAIFSYSFENSEENFKVYAYNAMTENFYAEIYNYEGNLTTKIIEEDNVLTAYDMEDNILMEISGRFDSSQEGISPLYTWTTEYMPVQGSTFINDVSIGVIAAVLGVDIYDSTGISLPDVALLSIAEAIANAAVNTVYYIGQARWGWDYGFSVVQVSLSFYQFSNFTGFLYRYDKIIPNHG